jgi:hypothetical protein
MWSVPEKYPRVLWKGGLLCQFHCILLVSTNSPIKHVNSNLIPATSLLKPCSIQRLPRLLSLDIFAGQKTKELIDCFEAFKGTASSVPAGTAGFVQVFDAVINRSLRARIEDLADLYIDEHEKNGQKANIR